MTTILIIEDEQSVRESIHDILDLEGFQSLEAADGQQGLHLAQKHLPDLILCDVQMPDMTGYEVLTQLQTQPPTATIPFIFLTARSTKNDIRQGMELGADDYLTKPCSANLLMRAIATRLEKQSNQRHLAQQQLDSLRSSIALSLPHELRTPITSIFTSVELLKMHTEGSDSEKLTEIADNIQTATQRLNRLIQRFLTYAQLELATRDPERLQAFQENRIELPVYFIADLAMRTAKQVGRLEDLEVKNSKKWVGRSLPISEMYLQKVVDELLDNAFKFSAANTPVRVSVRPIENEWHLEISNQGRGMTPEQIAEVGAYLQFERKFYEQQGVGLGLITVRRLTELHQGKLQIESVPGETTTVRVSFPVIT